MKAKLTFDLEDHDDKMAHMRCVKSLDMAIVLFEITRNLYKRVEQTFESEPQDRSEFDGMDEVFREIRVLMEENGINVDELID